MARTDRPVPVDSVPMRAPYGLEIIESCCPTARMGFSATSLPPAMQGLAAIAPPFSYPKGNAFR